MIRIKPIDAGNISDICTMLAEKNHEDVKDVDCTSCIAISIAVSKYVTDVYVNVIYEDSAYAGFFMYERSEKSAEKATIFKFVMSPSFEDWHEVRKRAFSHMLKGLKLQGVRNVAVSIDAAEDDMMQFYVSARFRLAEEPCNTAQRRCELEL